MEKKRPVLANLIALLDDPDDSITPVVRAHLLEMGQAVVPNLKKERLKSDNPVLVQRLERMISDIEQHYALQGLEDWVQSEDPELLKGLFWVLRLVVPECTYAPLSAQALDLAQEVWVELSEHNTAVEQIELFNHVFYHRISFEVDDPFLKEIDCARLDKVLENKKGNPVLYGILYILLASMSGLPVRAVSFPGGFLPVYLNESGKILFYVNIYKSGTIIGEKQLLEFLNTFNLPVPVKDFQLCSAVHLANIYAETLFFLFSSGQNKGQNNKDQSNKDQSNKDQSNKEMEHRMELALKIFGDQRILLMEEDDDE